jgi:hypothetical protein
MRLAGAAAARRRSARRRGPALAATPAAASGAFKRFASLSTGNGAIAAGAFRSKVLGLTNR